MPLPDTPGSTTTSLAARGAAGGVLMGLANLVPGISGGTMLLAAGIYAQFVGSVAEVSTLRFRLRSIVLLASVVLGAAVAIVGLAGVVKDLVVYHQWVMYSIFIGLTLGGVPLLWRMVRPADATVVLAAIVGILAMVALVLVQGRGAGTPAGEVAAGAGSDNNALPAAVMLLVAGSAGGAAMILPGISGGYLLLVLGQYVVILGAIAGARAGVTSGDWAAVADNLKILVPVGLGVVLGVVGVSNVVRFCLERFPRPTLGVLLGLLLGAVVGLWPFQEPGDGRDDPVDPDLPRAVMVPATPARLAGALGLAGLGLGVSIGISRIGGRQDTVKDRARTGR